MASKRKANNDSDIPAEKPKRRQENTTGEESVLCHGDDTNIPSCMCGCIVNYSRFEARIRQVFREEFAAAQHQSPRLSPNLSGGTFEAKQFRLVFSSKLKPEYYTEKKILAEGDGPVRIVLVDVRSQSIVNKGPMSSSEIEICVLPGDFGSGGDDQFRDWSNEEFNANIIVRPREGKKALLKGEDTRITLKGGVAFICKIEFTDISKWVRSGTFRLAAKSKEPNVREAISQPFVVKDKRGASIMKHVLPSLNSEIWRLRHIAKGKAIHKQLSADGIKTVGDFLRLLTINPSLLKEKVGDIPESKWEAIIEHARDCVIDDNVHYLYHTSERPLCLVFNPIYEVVKVSFDGQTYRSPETFTSVEKHSVEVAKKEAYENCKDFEPWALDLKELETLQVGQSSKGVPQQQVDLFATRQGQEFEWDLPGGSELLHYSPSLLDDVCRFLDLGASPSNHGGRKTKTVWRKIRAALQWLILRRSLCNPF